jgi:hypothetical protein
MHLYQNTFVRDTPVFRDYFLFGLGAQGFRNSERDVFNNLFIQTERVPGLVSHMKQAERLREGGNILWGLKDGPAVQGDFFAKFRASPLFADSRKQYEPGWTTQDRVVDPKFVSFTPDGSASEDLRLQAGSPANTGQSVPTGPTPARRRRDAPDIGALPWGPAPWGHRRTVPLFGERGR